MSQNSRKLTISEWSELQMGGDTQIHPPGWCSHYTDQSLQPPIRILQLEPSYEQQSFQSNCQLITLLWLRLLCWSRFLNTCPLKMINVSGLYPLPNKLSNENHGYYGHKQPTPPASKLNPYVLHSWVCPLRHVLFILTLT